LSDAPGRLANRCAKLQSHRDRRTAIPWEGEATGGQRRGALRASVLVLATLFWAGNFVFADAALATFDPLSLTWIRWLLALMPLLIVAQLVEKPDWRAAIRHLPFSPARAFSASPGTAFCSTSRCGFTSPLNASLINAVNPALIVVLAAVLPGAVQGGRRERISWRSALAIVIGLIGVVIVITDGDVSAIVRTGFNPGDLLMLAAILAWSIYTLVGRRIHDVPPITATAVRRSRDRPPDPVRRHQRRDLAVRPDSWERGRLHRGVPVDRRVRALERRDPQGAGRDGIHLHQPHGGVHRSPRTAVRIRDLVGPGAGRPARDRSGRAAGARRHHARRRSPARRPDRSRWPASAERHSRGTVAVRAYRREAGQPDDPHHRGFAGSLRLEVPQFGTRPTSDRVREAIFSALDARDAIDGARVLDLYAGSGALGLEAASRGAAHVTLVDNGVRAARSRRRTPHT
jgi:hypothetical protein